MNTATQQQPPKASTTNAHEQNDEQAFLAEVKKLEDTARQYQSEVSTEVVDKELSEQICWGDRDPRRTTQD